MTSPELIPCPGCNGTGQITYFGGVSRFQFTYEDCPECCGAGFLQPPATSAITAEQIAGDSGLSVGDAQRFLTVLSEILTTTIAAGEQIELRGFGSFTSPSPQKKSASLRFKPSRKLLH